MKMRVEELSAEQLNQQVARALALQPIPGPPGFYYWDYPGQGPRSGYFSPCDDWSQGGPLIEHFHILLDGSFVVKWYARCGLGHSFGNTALVAAMRALVDYKFGSEVES